VLRSLRPPSQVRSACVTGDSAAVVRDGWLFGSRRVGRAASAICRAGSAVFSWKDRST